MISALKISLVSVFICIAVLSLGQSVHYKFTENKGQFPEQVKFSTEIENGIIFFEEDRFTYSLKNAEDLARIGKYHGKSVRSKDLNVRCHAYEVLFENSKTAVIRGKNIQKGITSYFRGSDPSKWASGCSSYGEIIYEDLYEGIDLRIYANDFLLKFEYIVAPYADPSQIVQSYEFIDGLKLKNGRIEISTNAGLISEQRPVSFQPGAKGNTLVQSSYLKKKNKVTYTFSNGYDRSKELVIDPELIFSTYSGSTTDNFGYTASFDDEGFLYSGSSAFGNGYPTTSGSFEEDWGTGVVDIALSKVDTTGTFLVWSAYLGGDDDELPHSIMVNENNELYVLGSSSSMNFPVTANAYDSEYNGGAPLSLAGLGVNYTNGSDIILARISEDGSELMSCTYVGGSENDGLNFGSALKYNYADEIRGEIQLDDAGNVFVVSSTYSTDFPVSENAVQQLNSGNQEAIAFMMNPDLSNLEWGTYVGGAGNDAGYSLTFDQSGAVVICGGTQSTDFPVTSSAIQGSIGGGDADGFFTRIQNNGQSIDYSTYYGSSEYDQLYFTETDETDHLYVFGQTEHAASDFIFNATYNTVGGGQIISKFSQDLETLVWSTAFGTGGGQPNISPTAFLVDVCDRIYLSGWGGSTGGGGLGVTGMDVTADAYKDTSVSGDFYLMVLFDDASDIFYGSFFGGDTSSEHVDGGTSRFNRKGQVYQAVCAGCGSNDDFPIEPPGNAVSPTNNSFNCNLGVFKFDFQLPLTVADFIVPDQICVNQPFTIDNQSSFSQTFEWDFGDGSPIETSPNPTHVYAEPGTYEITLSVTSLETCNAIDQITKTVTIEFNSVSSLDDLQVCAGDSIVVGPSEINPNYSYTWSPIQYLSNSEIANPTVTPDEDISYILSVERSACVDTLFLEVQVENLDVQFPDDVLICTTEEVELSVTSALDISVTWSENQDFSNPLNDNSQDYTISPIVSESITYYALVEGELCTQSEQVVVSVFSEFVELQNDMNICAGDTISVGVINELTGAIYDWSPDNLILSGDGGPSVIVTAIEPIELFVTVSIEECEADDSINIGVINSSDINFNAFATPETIISGGESQLGTTVSGLNYSWTPTETLSNSEIQNPIASPLETTTYYVTGGEDDCFQSAEVTVRVVDFICGEPLVFLPNAFTPNDDGENDELRVYGENLTDVHLAVFNRWGQKVFETFDQDIGWDGVYNGKLSDPAVFDYYLEVTCVGGEDYFEKGNVTLIR